MEEERSFKVKIKHGTCISITPNFGWVHRRNTVTVFLLPYSAALSVCWLLDVTNQEGKRTIHLLFDPVKGKVTDFFTHMNTATFLSKDHS